MVEHDYIFTSLFMSIIFVILLGAIIVTFYFHKNNTSKNNTQTIKNTSTNTTTTQNEPGCINCSSNNQMISNQKAKQNMVNKPTLPKIKNPINLPVQNQNNVQPLQNKNINYQRPQRRNKIIKNQVDYFSSEEESSYDDFNFQHYTNSKLQGGIKKKK